MKLAIMQPYFLPYLGYFQLMSAVDQFVILDDVNYIKGGWINRNRIWSHGSTQWMSLPMKGASPNRLIHDVEVDVESRAIHKLVKSVAGAYQKAPQFAEVFPLFESIMGCPENNLSTFLVHSLQCLKTYLELPCQIEPTSRIYPKNDLTGVARVQQICEQTGAQQYVNLPGGRSLYDPEAFSALGVDLRFIDPSLPDYAGMSETGLSILDVIMHVPRSEAIKMANHVVLAE